MNEVIIVICILICIALGMIYYCFLYKIKIFDFIRVKLHIKRKSKIDTKQNGIMNFIEYKKGGNRIVYFLMVLFLFICLFIAIFPLIWLFVSSFKTTTELNSGQYHFWPEHININKIVEVWNATGFGQYFLNTIIIVIGAVVCAVLFNGLLAYGVSVVKPRGSKIIYYLILGSYMVPTILSIVPLFFMIKNLGLINTFIPLWLSFGANAFYFINFKNYFDKIPHELVEAMKVDGANDLVIFFKLIIPISKPIIGIVAIFATTAAWSDFLLPKLVLTNPDFYSIMVKLFSINANLDTMVGYSQDMFLMALVISILPQIFVFFIFQKQITGGGLDGGMKG